MTVTGNVCRLVHWTLIPAVTVTTSGSSVPWVIVTGADGADDAFKVIVRGGAVFAGVVAIHAPVAGTVSVAVAVGALVELPVAVAVGVPVGLAVSVTVGVPVDVAAPVLVGVETPDVAEAGGVPGATVLDADVGVMVFPVVLVAVGDAAPPCTTSVPVTLLTLSMWYPCRPGGGETGLLVSPSFSCTGPKLPSSAVMVCARSSRLRHSTGAPLVVVTTCGSAPAPVMVTTTGSCVASAAGVAARGASEHKSITTNKGAASTRMVTTPTLPTPRKAWVFG